MIRVTKLFLFGITFSKYLSLVLWCITFLALFVYSLFKKHVLPVNFYFDYQVIKNYMLSKAEFEFSDSFASTAAFYNVFIPHDGEILFLVISTMFILCYFLVCINKAKLCRMSFLEISLLFFCGFLAVSYMTMLSKDFIVLLVVSPFLLLARKGIAGSAAWTAIAIMYALFFRDYWFLFVLEFWAVYIFLVMFRKASLLIIFVPFTLLVLSAAFSYVLGVDLDHYRTAVNFERIEAGDEYANTMLTQWIVGDGVLVSWLNTMAVLVALIIPIPLAIMGGVYYLTIFSFILLLFYKFWQGAIRSMRSRERADPEVTGVVSLIVSFIAVQSIFEPDYGSYMRHLSPFFPLMLYVAFSHKSYEMIKGGYKWIES